MMVVEKLKHKGILKSSDRVAIGSQAIIETIDQGKGLSKKILNKLIECVGHRYDYLFR